MPYFAGRVDIELADGTRVGEGPLLSVTRWQSTRKLSLAGSFSFEMDAADPRASYVQKDRIARCWMMENSTWKEVGSGIIKSIQRSAAPGSDTVTVSGPDLLHEWSYRTVKLDLYTDSWVSPLRLLELGAPGYGVTANYPLAIDGNTGTDETITILLDPDFLYIGAANPFYKLDWTIGANQTDFEAFIKLQYFNGSWVEPDGFDDNTQDPGVVGSFGQDGTMEWTLPTDWRPGTVDGTFGYWARILNRDAPDSGAKQLSAFDVEELEVYERGTNADDLNPILDLVADMGWTFDTGAPGWDTTGNGTRATWNDITALQALIQQTELHGHAFRLGTGRQVEWLRDTAPDSGIIAMESSDPVAVEDNAAVCLLTRFELLEDSHEIYSRIIAYGAGRGAERLTLAAATDAAPAGYTRGQDAQGRWYLQHTATHAAIGVRELVRTFSSLGGSDVGAAPGNQLQDAAEAELAAHLEARFAYGFDVVKLDGTLQVGDTIDVVFRRAVLDDDGNLYWAHDIDTIRDNSPLHVLAITTQVDAAPARTVALEIGSTRRRQLSGMGVLVAMARELAAAQQGLQAPALWSGAFPLELPT